MRCVLLEKQISITPAPTAVCNIKFLWSRSPQVQAYELTLSKCCMCDAVFPPLLRQNHAGKVEEPEAEVLHCKKEAGL